MPLRLIVQDHYKSLPKRYRVIKEIDNVKEGLAIPWFGQPGLGKQFQLPEGINYLLKNGFIIEI